MSNADGGKRWYAVRTFFRWGQLSSYEERITLWRAASFDDAFALAQAEGDRYAAQIESDQISRLPESQAHMLVGDLDEGEEVFSLLRDSDADPETYVRTFFMTGAERLQSG